MSPPPRISANAWHIARVYRFGRDGHLQTAIRGGAIRTVPVKSIAGPRLDFILRSL